MSIKSLFHFSSHPTRNTIAAMAAAVLGIAYGAQTTALTTTTPLADAPVLATTNVPGNMLFTLSVEYPTALSVANLQNYADGGTYLGYFDPAKCYTYQYNSITPSSSYFRPAAFGSGTNGHSCSGQWSGNFMNWATMQTIDPFRWVLTGGYRSVDQVTYPQTILEKAWGSAQGGLNNYPWRGTYTGYISAGNQFSTALISSLTPFNNWANFGLQIWGNGNAMVFSQGAQFAVNQFQNTSNVSDISTSAAQPPSGTNDTTIAAANYNNFNDLAVYRVFVRVSVCDTSVLGVAGLESNCVGYGTSSQSNGNTVYSIYKPQGLVQQYSNQIKYGVVGYLNTANTAVQGGTLREPMEYVGPTYPQPLSTQTVTNPTAEWSAATGVMSTNPDPTTAAGTAGVTQSGVMNYLNKFGEYGASQYLAGNSNYANNSNIYMTFDRVSEMYYAGVRYFEHLGNVPEWAAQSSYGPTSVQFDGFPAVTTWADPIAYSCQKNFIVGIGDDHTWTDYDVGGSTQFSQDIDNHYPAPSLVQSDSVNKANTWLFALENLEGMTQTPWFSSGAGAATYYIAGLAYGTHVLDIRPDLGTYQNGVKTSPISTISTYWMDVAEDQEVENLNQYYLAAKYGGFTVPAGYSITNTTPLPLSEYDTTNSNIVMNGNNTHPLPDNYFEASNANQMVASLTKAFSNIAIAVSPYATSFALSSPVIASAGAQSFSSQYSSSNWTSVITANTLTFVNAVPQQNQLWLSSATLQSQFAGTGWQAPYANGTTGRNIATWSGSAGEAFESGSIMPAQLSALAPTSYSPLTSGATYLSYLRGDTTNQVGSAASPSTRSLRARALLLGDIVDANLASVSTPNMSYSDSYNPGYSAFVTQWTNTTPRPTMVYAAANDGMLHGLIGSSGYEQFAYVPSALFQGPSGTPQLNGLAALGNPNYTHHYYVDATPGTFDLDLNRTNGNTSGSPNWRTMLIGGLGKGGTSYYALDVTNPAAMTSESVVAGDVLWEFNDSNMGYSFGTPVVVKTAQYGWVVILTSGYDNADGFGYLYIVNPTNGAMLQKIKTPSASLGLAAPSAYVQDYSNYTADSVYVGDLNGQVWRFDLTAATGNYPAPTLIATLTDSSGVAQPVTSPPLIEIHPTTRERYILIGTGQLLSSTDIVSSQTQSFYAIIDGTSGAFKTVTTPATRATLVPVTNITSSITVPAGYNGWYFDLPSGYRVVSEAVAYNGVVAFSALQMSTNPCSPQGSSEVYAVNYATGTSVLNSTSSTTTNSNTTTTPAPFVTFNVAVNNLRFVSNAGTTELLAGTTNGALAQVGANLTSTSATRLLNWREIPTTE